MNPNLQRLAIWAIALVLLAALANLFNNNSSSQRRGSNEVSYSKFLADVEEGKVTRVTLAGKRLSVDLDPITLTAVAAAIALVCFLPLAVVDAVGHDWAAAGSGAWVALLWWGAGTMGLGSWLWFQGMARVRPGTASAFMAVMPISALVLSYLLLGEAFQWIHLIGMAVVLAGLAAVVRSGASVH